MEVETTDLGEGVQAIVLKDGDVFPFWDDPTKVLFVRECIRNIADSIVECRKKKRYRNAAIIGQPGIGKSYCLFYLAHRFLQEDDVEAVVLEASEKGIFHVFYKNGYDQSVHEKLRQGSQLLVTESNAELIDSELLCRDNVVYIVDMAEEEPPSIKARSKGFTVLSSSPRPYKKHVERVRAYKEGMKLFSPTPWPREEIKVVFDYASDFKGGNLGIQMWAKEVKRPFEDYFNLFGGTLRGLHRPEEEMKRMAQGATKLEEIFPDQILDLVVKGAGSVGEDFTHTLFSEVGGAQETSYIVEEVPTKRQFRSCFTNFWFRKYVAPRILFKHYKTECLNVLYHTSQSADPGKRGVEFEDFFHRLLLLGKWNIMDLAYEHNTPGPSGLEEFLRYLGGWLSKEAAGKVSEGTIDLKGAPVKKRDEDKYAVNISKWTGWGDDETPENKRDVCHLVDVWNDTEDDGIFYWIPFGKQFPGLDSVYKEGSSNLYFIQVKTGNDAKDVSGWIDKAVKISTLLYEKLGRPEIKCTLVVGCEPQRAPVLGKRKRRALFKSHQELKTWGLKYLVAPLPIIENKPHDIKLNWEIFHEMETEFHSFLHLLNQEGGKESVEGEEESEKVKKKATSHH